MRKRIFSILLTIAVCLSMMPAGVWAADGETSVQGTNSEHSHCICGGNTDVNGHSHSTDLNFQPWTETDKLPDEGNYYLTESVTISGTWSPTGEVVLCLNGKIISGSIKVEKSAALTMTDCTAKGKIQGSNSAVGVTVNGGTFNMYSGTITGFTNGVQVGLHSNPASGSTLNMYGGTITENNTDGGVFLVGTTNSNITAPSFIMHGGTISNNTAGASDGGAEEWYREKAPRDPMHINIMKRYQYFTQAMVEIADGRPDAALMTLSPLELYCENCAKYIDSIHLYVLKAIALYRKKDDKWKDSLNKSLKPAEEFKFIRPVSVYGTAVLPLLEALSTEKDSKWYRRLMTDVRAQAAFYPHFLQTRLALGEALTPMELQILHLICADKSNAEIGQIMDIKLPTVKTHVSHILSKLDVKRRSEAKTAAKKLRLVPENL